MSTLRVNNITDATGGSTGISVPGAAKAWVNFNGTGTVAIRSSLNTSSITDNGTGNYTVNFATALGDANYAWTGSADGYTNNTNGAYVSHGPTNTYSIIKSATQLRAVTMNDSGSVLDPSQVSVVVFD